MQLLGVLAISGNVVSLNGMDVSRLTVEICWSENLKRESLKRESVVTDASGYYNCELKGLGVGNLIELVVGGGRSNDVIVHTNSRRVICQRDSRVRLDLYCAEQSCTVEGLLLWSDGVPVIGGHVWTAESQESVTDSRGWFSVRGPLCDDRLTIYYCAPDDSDEGGDISLSCRQGEAIAERYTGVVLVLPRPTWSTRVIVRDENGAGLNG